MILYLVGETFSMSRQEAFRIYGTFLGILFISSIIGALIGDILDKNRNIAILGGLLSALGAFVLVIPSIYAYYIGIGFIAIGSGIYVPNLLAEFGKLYNKRTKLLDSGFLMIVLSVNVGSFFGTLLIGRLGEGINYSYAFILSGIMMLIAVMIFSFSKKPILITEKIFTKTLRKRIVYVIMAIFLVGFFWSTYEFALLEKFELQKNLLEYFSMDIHDRHKLDLYWLLPSFLFGVLGAVVWSYVYYGKFTKLIIGFLFATISVGLMLLLPEVLNRNSIMLIALSIFFLSIAEIHIEPVMLSVITKYSNPRYYATVMSLALAFSGYFISVYFFGFRFFGVEDSQYTLIGFIAFAVIVLGLLLYSIKIFKKSSN